MAMDTAAIFRICRGCVAVGDTYEETERLIREAIPFHLQGLRFNGDAIPEPAIRIEFVDAELPA
jgi:predicted RNase H-like HicB family nuclease